MRQQCIEQLERLYPQALRRDVPMREYTTFRIGGPAAAVLLAQDETQLVQAVALCARCNEPYFVMGNGSNLLVSDLGIRGLVIMVRDALDQISVKDDVLIAGAGARLARVAETAAAHGLSGLEFASGIPGCLGGALTMNAGAYGGEMAQVVQRVRLIESDASVHTLTADQLEFGYRTSAIANGRIALDAVFQLKREDPDKIVQTMRTYQQARREKQPLEYPSAGSVFKRPQGYFAGALIDQAGLRGTRIGGAQVSQKHAGFIVNVGGATCQDVLDLIELIQQRVFQTSGVELCPELRPIGEGV